MGKIKELNADQLADYAWNIFLVKGRHAMGARLIYQCLELNDQHPLGLRCLSDFLDYKGSEAISAIVLEHIIEHKIPQTPESQWEHEKLLYSLKWYWKFASHKSGKTELNAKDFEIESDFIIDQEAYEQFIGRAITVAGSREGVLKGAQNLIGLYGGATFSTSIRENHSPLDMLALSNFETTEKYAAFLEEDSSPLVEIKEKVQVMKRSES